MDTPKKTVAASVASPTTPPTKPTTTTCSSCSTTTSTTTTNTAINTTPASSHANSSAESPCGKELPTEAQRSIQQFWPGVLREIKLIENVEPGNQLLPLARIKKIMKLDEDVKMISSDAPLLFAKAIEIFIQELTLRAWLHTEHNKRRTLQRSDIAMAITKYDQFDFLIDIVPRDEIKVYKKEYDGKSQDDSPPGVGGSTGASNGTPGSSTNGSDDMQYILQLAQQHRLTLQSTDKGLAGAGTLTNGATVLDLATVIGAAAGNQQLLQAGTTTLTTQQENGGLGGTDSVSALQNSSPQSTLQTATGQSIILSNGTATTGGVANGSAAATSQLLSTNQSVQLVQHVMTPTGEITQIPISIPQNQLNFIRTAGNGGGPNGGQPIFIQSATMQSGPTIIHPGPTSVFLSANQLQQLQQHQQQQQQNNHNQTQQ
uniref:Nuclear transcription factor Y subunit gamma n=1 Tax=Anopheles christyi TaxID=43041 RepID=A0A182KFX9_9DIPT